MGNAVRHQEEAAGTNEPTLLAHLNVELALEQVPRLVDGIVNMERWARNSRCGAVVDQRNPTPRTSAMPLTVTRSPPTGITLPCPGSKIVVTATSVLNRWSNDTSAHATGVRLFSSSLSGLNRAEEALLFLFGKLVS
jgi:hypothetical protein